MPEQREEDVRGKEGKRDNTRKEFLLKNTAECSCRVQQRKKLKGWEEEEEEGQETFDELHNAIRAPIPIQ